MAKNDKATPAQSATTAPAMASTAKPSTDAANVPAPQTPTQENASMTTTANLGTTGGTFRPVFTVKKILTLPLLKLEVGKAAYVKFLGEIFTGKELKNAQPGEAKKAPPEMANVVNLETGEQCQIMLGKVLKDLIDEEYPNHHYVGKGFMIELTEKKRGRGGNSYNTYKLAEIELPA